MGVVDKSVKDGIGEGGIANGFVPVLGRQLGGDEGGAPVVSVFGDLEEVAALVCGEHFGSPVVEDEEVGAEQGFEQAFVASESAGGGEFLEQAGGAEVADAVAFAAGFVCECASEVAFAGSGGSGEDAVVVLMYPAASGEFEHEGFVESAGVAVVDVFDAGVEPELGAFEPGVEAAVVLFEGFAFDEHGEALVETESVVLVGFELFVVGPEHPVEFEGLQLVEGGVGKHGLDSPFVGLSLL